jgi:hypothetical protein
MNISPDGAACLTALPIGLIFLLFIVLFITVDNKMLPRVCQRLLLSMMLSSLLSAAATAAEPGPMPVDSPPEPGWTGWKTSAEIATAGFDSGFSNLELGGFLEFQDVCSQALGTPMNTVPYWFRLNHSVERIGTGSVEFGCWQKGKFVHTMESTAMSTKFPSVSCLRVQITTGQDLRIRAEPGLSSKVLGSVRNGSTIKLSSSPAIVTLADGRNWVAIEAPRQGWVSDDRPDSTGNLIRCQ